MVRVKVGSMQLHEPCEAGVVLGWNCLGPGEEVAIGVIGPQQLDVAHNGPALQVISFSNELNAFRIFFCVSSIRLTLSTKSFIGSAVEIQCT